MHTLSFLILGPMVYAALAVFVLGVIYRIRRVLARPSFAPTLQMYPEKKPAWLFALGDALIFPRVARQNLPMYLALVVFHAGLLLLIAGHLELIADFKWLQRIPHAVFLGQGALGLSMLACLFYFFCRRLVSPTKDISVPSDYLLLALLGATTLLGAQMVWAASWFDYQTISLADLRAYFVSLLALKPNTAGLENAGHAFLLAAHVFFANLLLMVLPFTKLMHFAFAIALNKIRRG